MLLVLVTDRCLPYLLSLLKGSTVCWYCPFILLSLLKHSRTTVSHNDTSCSQRQQSKYLFLKQVFISGSMNPPKQNINDNMALLCASHHSFNSLHKQMHIVAFCFSPKELDPSPDAQCMTVKLQQHVQSFIPARAQVFLPSLQFFGLCLCATYLFPPMFFPLTASCLHLDCAHLEAMKGVMSSSSGKET